MHHEVCGTSVASSACGYDNLTSSTIPNLLPGESPSNFVQRLPPSKPSAEPWYWVQNPSRKIFTRKEREYAQNLLTVLWESIPDEKKPLKSLWNVCSDESLTAIESGEWWLYVKNDVVDDSWKKIVEGVASGKLGISAKVAPQRDCSPIHVICVYTRSFKDEVDINRVLRALIEIGFEGYLTYKADCMTYLGIYKNNKYGIPPTFYRAISYKQIAEKMKQPPGIDKYFLAKRR